MTGFPAGSSLLRDAAAPVSAPRAPTGALPARPATGDGAPHAIVIGSGFGGLAAAIRLGARGYRVTVLEKLDAAGGRAYVYRQDGFTFDAGPTIVTAPFLFEELWTLCGRRMADDVTLKAISPFYRIRFDDGDVFDRHADGAAVRREVARLSPGDVEGFDRFMAASEDIFRVGFEELGDASFSSVTDMLRILPDLIAKRGHRTVYGFVSRFIRDPRLRTALSFHPLHHGCLLPDRLSGTALGRAFRNGRHQPAGRGPVRPDRRPGRRHPSQYRSRRNPG